jgi:hypothetical protein
VLCLAVGVEGDQVERPERPAANLGGVVLDEAVVAPGAAFKLRSALAAPARDGPGQLAVITSSVPATARISALVFGS